MFKTTNPYTSLSELTTFLNRNHIKKEDIISVEKDNGQFVAVYWSEVAEPTVKITSHISQHTIDKLELADRPCSDPHEGHFIQIKDRKILNGFDLSNGHSAMVKTTYHCTECDFEKDIVELEL